MKTLDEVIEAERHCVSGGCMGCPYDIDKDGCKCDEDALHYLKEYQTILPLVPSLINTAIEVQKKGKTIG